jgi:hypothetical protein
MIRYLQLASVFAVDFLELFSGLFYQSFPGLRAFPAKKLQFFTFQFIRRDEKFLNLGTDLLGQIARVECGLLAVRVAGGRQ